MSAFALANRYRDLEDILGPFQAHNTSRPSPPICTFNTSPWSILACFRAWAGMTI